jgi:hypothetical protein
LKKIIFACLLFSAFVFAKDMRVDVCRGDNCYTYTVPDAKDYRYIHDMNGRKYLRIFKYNNRVLDIFVDGMTVKVGK